MVVAIMPPSPALKLGITVKRGAPRPITVEAGPCSLPIVTLALTEAEASALLDLIDDALTELRA